MFELSIISSAVDEHHIVNVIWSTVFHGYHNNKWSYHFIAGNHFGSINYNNIKKKY